MFHKCFKDVWKLQKCFNRVLKLLKRKFEMCFKQMSRVSPKFQGLLQKVFQGRFKGVSFMGFSWGLQGCKFCFVICSWIAVNTAAWAEKGLVWEHLKFKSSSMEPLPTFYWILKIFLSRTNTYLIHKTHCIAHRFAKAASPPIFTFQDLTSKKRSIAKVLKQIWYYLKLSSDCSYLYKNHIETPEWMLIIDIMS